MIIIYDTKTGNVERFVKKLNLECYRISTLLRESTPFVLVTYTTGFGSVPDTTMRFLDEYSYLLRGVAASGNQNWGDNFAKAADIISELYSVPIIHKFELSGTLTDIKIFKEGLRDLEAH